MALKLPDIEESCDASVLNLFSMEPRDDVIYDVKEIALEPHVPLRGDSRQVIFRMEPISQWIQLSETRLEGTLKIVKNSDKTDIEPHRIARAAVPAADGNPAVAAVTAYESAGFDQFPINLAIKSVEVRWNDAVVSTTDTHYGISAYVITMLNNDKHTLDTKAESYGFYLEKKPSNTDLLLYSGFKKRYSNTEGSSPYSLSSPIFSPVFLQNKALLPMMRLSMDFNLQNASYFIKSGVPVADQDFDYVIDDFKLVLKLLYVTSDFQLRFEKRLASGQNALYEIPNFNLKSYIVGAGRSEFAVANPFDSSFVPTHSVVFFAGQAESIGQFGSSPLSFRHHNVKNIRILINDAPCPSLPFNINWVTGKFIRAFQALHGDNFSVSNTVIDKNLFKDEHCFFCFDMNMPKCGAAPRTKALGQCKLEVEFMNTGNPILKCYVWFMQLETIQITSNREVIKNY